MWCVIMIALLMINHAAPLLFRALLIGRELPVVAEPYARRGVPWPDFALPLLCLQMTAAWREWAVLAICSSHIFAAIPGGLHRLCRLAGCLAACASGVVLPRAHLLLRRYLAPAFRVATVP